MLSSENVLPVYRPRLLPRFNHSELESSIRTITICCLQNIGSPICSDLTWEFTDECQTQMTPFSEEKQHKMKLYYGRFLL